MIMEALARVFACLRRRYGVSDRSASQGPGTPLRYNPDGTLTVYLAHQRPPASKQVRGVGVLLATLVSWRRMQNAARQTG